MREWQAYDAIDPIGGYRGDLQAALIAQQVAARPGSKLTDYLVVDPNPRTPEQQVADAKTRKAALEQANFEKLKRVLENKAKPII